ncbi:MAG: gas vesicle protein [Deltaproteobacteria bacterium]
MTDLEPNDQERISLCEALDRVLNKGAVVSGEVMISVADVDLLYLGLRLVLTSIETARSVGLQSSATAAFQGSGIHGTRAGV